MLNTRNWISAYHKVSIYQVFMCLFTFHSRVSQIFITNKTDYGKPMPFFSNMGFLRRNKTAKRSISNQTIFDCNWAPCTVLIDDIFYALTFLTCSLPLGDNEISGIQCSFFPKRPSLFVAWTRQKKNNSNIIQLKELYTRWLQLPRLREYFQYGAKHQKKYFPKTRVKTVRDWSTSSW